MIVFVLQKDVKKYLETEKRRLEEVEKMDDRVKRIESEESRKKREKVSPNVYSTILIVRRSQEKRRVKVTKVRTCKES